MGSMLQPCLELWRIPITTALSIMSSIEAYRVMKRKNVSQTCLNEVFHNFDQHLFDVSSRYF